MEDRQDPSKMSDAQRLAWWTYVIFLCGLPMFALLSGIREEETASTPWLYYLVGVLIVYGFGYGGEVLNVFNSMNDTVIVVGIVVLFLSLPFVYLIYLTVSEIEFTFAGYIYSFGVFMWLLVPVYVAFLGVPVLYFSQIL